MSKKRIVTAFLILFCAQPTMAADKSKTPADSCTTVCPDESVLDVDSCTCKPRGPIKPCNILCVPPWRVNADKCECIRTKQDQ